MRTRNPCIAFASAALTAALTAIAVPAPAMAQEEEALVSFKALKPATALRLAQATLEGCRAQGYQITVAVVDRAGIAQVVLRDRFAGPHTLSTAERKAWTAVSFRIDTLSLDQMISKGELPAGLRDVSNALALGGGVPVESAGSVVGGVGVSGAPDPAIDDECARIGIDAIVDEIGF